MSYFESIFIKQFLDSPSLGPFGRLKTANPYTQFDSKQTGGNPLGTINFVSKSINGATFVSGTYEPLTVIGTTTSSGSRAIIQSRRRMNYFPGRGLQTIETFVFGTGSQGIVKRIGYYDEENGIFLEQSGSDINLVLRSKLGPSVTETKISQSQWNIDPFDGSTSSLQAEALDFTKAQIFELDFQWLGVSRVRTFFATSSGSIVPVHDFRHANRISGVYMATPNLPIRAEVENYEGVTSNSMKVICSSVSANGASDPLGIKRSINTGVSASVLPGTTRSPLISMKIKSGSLGRNVVPLGMDILATTTVDFMWEIIFNPLFGADDAAWIPLPRSAIEYDTTRTVPALGGVVLASGFGSSTNQTTFSITEDVTSNLILGATVDGVSDEITLAVTPLTTGNFVGAISFKEFD